MSSNKMRSLQKKKSASLPAETVDYLKAWMMSPEHIAHPYPTEQEKAQIMADTGIELKQLTNWFVNNRKRYWKPRVEARLQQHAQAQAVVADSVMSDTEAPSTKPAAIVEPRTPPRPERRVNRVSVVAQDNLSVFVPSPVSLRAVVSDVSSSSSYSSETETETASVVSSQDDDFSSYPSEEVVNGTVARTETVDVQVLRPLNGMSPTIADVSILANVPSQRILRAYETCELTYRFSVDSIQDRKKVQSCRDAEIVRLKSRYLKMYLAEEGAKSLKRLREQRTCDVPATPRKKYRRQSPKLWRTACKVADGHGYDKDLPTLDEAALLFGIVGKVLF